MGCSSRRHVGLGCVLALSGCSSADVVWLEAGEHHSVIILAATTIRVRSVGGDGSVEIETRSGEELSFLLYRETLEELRLVSGDLDRRSKGRRLPPPAAITHWWDGRLEDGRLEDVDLAALRMPWPNDDPCLHFELESVIELPGTAGAADVTVAVFEPERALVVTSSGRFFELSSAGGLRALQVEPGLPAAAVYARLDTGEVWLSSHAGAVARGHPDRGFEPMPTRTSTWSGGRVWLDGARDGAPTELYAVTQAGRFERFDGARWTLLEDSGLEEPEGVIWLGPGRAIAAQLFPGTMTHYADGELSRSELPLPLGVRLKSVHWVPGFGPMAGTVSGLLLRWNGQLWTPLPGAPTGARVFGIVPREQGIVFGGERGLLQQYVEEHGYCDGVPSTAFDLSELDWLGDRIVGCGGNPGERRRCAVIRERR